MIVSILPLGLDIIICWKVVIITLKEGIKPKINLGQFLFCSLIDF